MPRRLIVLAILVMALAGCAKTTEVNTPSAGGATTTTTAAGASGKAATTTTKPVAHTGSTLTLSTVDGQTYSVALKQVIDPAQGSDQFTTPDPGKRFVATLFTVTNTGTKALSGDANNDASVIGSDNQSYSADFNNVAECTNFNSGSVQLGAGESVTGCVVFQVPTGVTVAKVQWAPSSGLANDFGEWLNP